MKSIKMSLAALALATLALTAPTRPAFAGVATDADNAAAAPAVDNQFVDGNWFGIATAAGEDFKTGSPTQVALQAQLDAYQSAVDAKDLAKEEHFAIRSWVKGWVAAEIGLEALQSGDLAGAKKALLRAKKYGMKAQKPGAGLGETPSRVGDDTAPAFGGTSSVEGARVVAYADKYLAQVSAKLGETGAQE
jgi:hypothetical protein